MLAATGCNLVDDAELPVEGEQCEREGETVDDLVCEEGQWVGDEECEPEDDEAFCERHDAECGEVSGDDNCEQTRTVDCSDFESFQCTTPHECITPEMDSEFDANVCVCACEIDGDCLQTGQSPPDAPCQICDPAQSRSSLQEIDDGSNCGEHAVCEAGECVCDGGFSDCSNQCVDTDTDPDHCNECDNSCPEPDIDDAEPACKDGECAARCIDDDEIICEETRVLPTEDPEEFCVNPDADDNHCGSCNNRCGSNAHCDSGECVCDDGYDYCEDAGCVDLDEDDEHCGGCGDACDSDEICSGGDCSCPPASCDDAECGTVENDCGSSIDCGSCPGFNQFCNPDNECVN